MLRDIDSVVASDKPAGGALDRVARRKAFVCLSIDADNRELGVGNGICMRSRDGSGAVNKLVGEGVIHFALAVLHA